MRYSLGNVEIDPDRFAVRRDGVLVKAEPRVLEFIFYVAQHADRMVPKSELLQHVWQKRCVSDSALTRAACLARKLLMDSSVIRTVYGRGYQWMGPIKPSPGDGDHGVEARE